MTVETELKLRLVPEQVEDFLQHPLLQAVSPTRVVKHLISAYFDTPTCDLLRQGIGLRIRRVDDRFIQTVKTGPRGLGGLHQRQEWEVEVEQNAPDLSQLPNELLPLLDTVDLNQLQELFTTDFERQTWQVTTKERGKIEIALDRGKILTACASEPLLEIELELKAGSLAELYAVALVLQKALALTLENHSKAERGYRLHQPQAPQACKATPIKLSASRTVEQAFVTIFWHCLEHWQANEDVILYGEDSEEGVHQLRVATRRLRTLLKFYNPLLATESYRQLRKDIKWVANMLSTAREWDVFADTLLSIQSQLPNDSLLKEFRAVVASQRLATSTKVRALLRSARYHRLLLRLGYWVTRQEWRLECADEDLARLNQPLPRFASKVLTKCHNRVVKKCKQLEQSNAKQRHVLRLAVKRLNYATRFFSALYPLELTNFYEKSVSQLQDELGILNDVSCAPQLLNQTGVAADAPVRYLLRGWYVHQQWSHLTRLVGIGQAFLAQEIFWE